MTRLVHPVTGGEFDAPERSVPVYEQSGWTVKDAAPPPPAPSGKAKSAAGQSAESQES